MLDPISKTLFQTTWWSYALRVACFYILAYGIYRLAPLMAAHLARLQRLAPKTQRQRPERQETLRSLIAGTIGVMAFAAATFGSLGLFVPLNTLVWMIGLFSAAFGLGARPLISDYLTGVSLIFEDTFAVGEKVELQGVEGVVENVGLRTTLLRASTGELYVIPNGEVRMVRNFSRGRFSTAHVTLKVTTCDLGRALPILEDLAQDAVALLPNLLEPWQIISESGVLGQQTELTLLARARFSKAAEMRPRLLELVQERLTEKGISLGD
jgi:small-conductance mechanosensitive channel